MPEQAIAGLVEYGALGLMIILLVWFLIMMRNDHKRQREKERAETEAAFREIGERNDRERAEHRQTSCKQFDTIIEVVKENSTVMSELKTLIKQFVNTKS